MTNHRADGAISTPAAEQGAGKHTPGPWRLTEGDFHDHSEDGDLNGFTVAMGEYDEGGGLVIHHLHYADGVYPSDNGYVEAEANANLIAAAPTMLDALKHVGNVMAIKDAVKEDDELWAAFSVVIAAISEASSHLEKRPSTEEQRRPEQCE